MGLSEADIRGFFNNGDPTGMTVQILFRDDRAHDLSYLLQMVWAETVTMSPIHYAKLLLVARSGMWQDCRDRQITLTITWKFEPGWFVGRMCPCILSIERIDNPADMGISGGRGLRRPTNKSLAELERDLTSADVFIRVASVHEIGLIALLDKNNHEQAEAILRNLLRSDDPKLRQVAYTFLLAKSHLEGSTFREIARFQDCPENKDMLLVAINGAQRLRDEI
jgi:hypothetical protein